MSTAGLSPDASETRPAGVRGPLVFGTLFALGLVLGAGALDRAGALAMQGFELVARAHYEIYLAQQNENADGLHEYAVLLRDDGAYESLRRFAAQAGDLPVRRSSLPGWAIVAVPPERATSMAQSLRGSDFARAVLRNRGIWICH